MSKYWFYKKPDGYADPYDRTVRLNYFKLPINCYSYILTIYVGVDCSVVTFKIFQNYYSYYVSSLSKYIIFVHSSHRKLPWGQYWSPVRSTSNVELAKEWLSSTISNVKMTLRCFKTFKIGEKRLKTLPSLVFQMLKSTTSNYYILILAVVNHIIGH